jgi:hypothetical protein
MIAHSPNPNPVDNQTTLLGAQFLSCGHELDPHNMECAIMKSLSGSRSVELTDDRSPLDQDLQTCRMPSSSALGLTWNTAMLVVDTIIVVPMSTAIEWEEHVRWVASSLQL